LGSMLEKYRRRCRSVSRVAAVCLVVGVMGWIETPLLRAEREPDPPKPNPTLDADVEQGLTHLLDLAQNRGNAFDPDQIRALIEYSMSGQDRVEQDTPASRFGGRGAVVRGRIEAAIERILRYAYNPFIPSYLVMPKMLRLSGWYPESDLISGKIALWEKLPDLRKPVVLHGREFEITTPDIRSGGYYRYDLNRMLILLQHNGVPVLVSVSRSVEPSDVGKRAFIVDDANWMYLYSNDTGLALNWVQWMDTFIYESGSVMIFHAAGDGRPVTGATLFKWLNAGWWGMNVVREKHIRRGSRRSLDHLEAMMESEELPAPETIARRYERVQALSDENLDRLIRNYADQFRRAALVRNGRADDDIQDILRDGGYARLLNRQERIGAVMIEYLKLSLGKKTLINPDLIHSLLAEPSTGSKTVSFSSPWKTGESGATK